MDTQHTQAHDNDGDGCLRESVARFPVSMISCTVHLHPSHLHAFAGHEAAIYRGFAWFRKLNGIHESHDHYAQDTISVEDQFTS